MRKVSLILIAVISISCSTAPVGERYPASTGTASYCRQLIRNIFQSNRDISSPNLVTKLADERSKERYAELVLNREEKLSKELFSEDEIKILREQEFDYLKLADNMQIHGIDDVHFLTYASKEEIDQFFKTTDQNWIRSLVFFTKSDQSIDYTNPHLSVLFRRKAPAGTEPRSLEEIRNLAEAYYVSPRGGATTRAKKLKAYRVVIDRSDVDFDESLIPKLIGFYRLAPQEFAELTKKMPVEELQAFSEVARQFQDKYKAIYFFDVKGPNEELYPTSDLSYVFGRFANELRAREKATVIKKASVVAEETPPTPIAAGGSTQVLSDAELDKLQKSFELTVKEDTFSFDETVSDQDLLFAVQTIYASGHTRLMNESILKILRDIAEVEKDESLHGELIVQKLVQRIHSKMKKEDLDYVMGRAIRGSKKIIEETASKGWSHGEGPRNMHRGWAWRLLPDDDPAWQDPVYLAYHTKVSNASGGGLSAQDRYLYEDIKNMMRNEWEKLDKKFRPVEFTTTGSDANNLLYAHALTAARSVHGREVKDAEILFFDELYGGVRGKMAGVGYHGMGKEGGQILDEYKLPTAKTYDFNPTDPEEIQRLDEIEADVLKQIKEKVQAAAQTEKPIGGLFFEAIQANRKGVNMFRPEFILKIQELCKELQIPIMVDEIMSGGGRTGKMWAHEWYPGFEPDFITFGKGMQVAGVAVRNGTRYRGGWGPVTQEVVVESMLKAWVVMKAINDRELLKNAEEMGKYIVKRVRELAGNVDPTIEMEYPRGVGMMIWPGRYFGGAQGAEGRLFPYLTMTRQEVDEVLPKPDQ